jgi:dTDP-4-dehydrorhamnose 3,5-epimerase
VKTIHEFPEGLISIYPAVFGDDRGFFLESFNQAKYASIIPDLDFVQDNLSKSKKGVLRGLHFQAPPFDQGKLVQVITGSVLDVAVDIRKNAPSYGKHFKIILNSTERNQLWIPPGFAHGFVSLEDGTIFSYKCTNSYSKEHEGCILWNDLDLGIDWEIDQPLISPKDQEGTLFKDFISPF